MMIMRGGNINHRRHLLVAICVLLAPILSNYVFISQVSIGDVLVCFTLPWLFTQLNFNWSLGVNVVISFVIILASYFLLGDVNVYVGFYRTAFYYFVIVLLMSNRTLNLHSFIGVYSGICIFSSCVIIMQWVAYVAFNVSMPIQLPLESYEPDTLNVIDHVFRAGGVFKEPSYYAIYVMPYLIYISLGHNLKSFFLVSLAGVLSTSSLMFFLISACIVLVCLGVLSVYSTFVFVFVAIVTFSQLYLSGVFDGYVFMERVHSIFVDGGTLNERFLPFYQILELADPLAPSIVVMNFYRSADMWFNSASSIMVYFGGAGLGFLILNLRKFNLLFGFLFLMLLFSTHFMAGPFSYFIVIAFIVFGDYFSIAYQKGFKF